MTENKVFYYHFDKVNSWLVLNAVLSIVLVHCLYKCPCLWYWWQTQVLGGVAIVSWLLWGYKYLLKHKLAVFDKDTVTIDHCRPLLWKDVESVEKKEVRCWFKKYPVLVFNLKQGADYQYNFLQRHNCGFTPFSLPLYNIVKPEDIEQMKELIKQKVKNIKD